MMEGLIDIYYEIYCLGGFNIFPMGDERKGEAKGRCEVQMVVDLCSIFLLFDQTMKKCFECISDSEGDRRASVHSPTSRCSRLRSPTRRCDLTNTDGNTLLRPFRTGIKLI